MTDTMRPSTARTVGSFAESPLEDGAAQRGFAAVFATGLAAIEVTALALDSNQSFAHSFALGHTLAWAVFDYVRFFTILTNTGLAILMSLTAVGLWRRRPIAAASVFRAATVYMIVTCLTYELLLRSTWTPEGLQFFTDLTFHDLAPVLVVLFWIGCAPKHGLAWRDLPWVLVFPALYFAATLMIGAVGMAGYPYDFLNPDKLGYPAIAEIAVVFLGLFLALGAALTAIGRLMGGRAPADTR